MGTVQKSNNAESYSAENDRSAKIENVMVIVLSLRVLKLRDVTTRNKLSLCNNQLVINCFEFKHITKTYTSNEDTEYNQNRTS